MGKRRSEKRRKARSLFDDSISKKLYTYEQYADIFVPNIRLISSQAC